MPPEQQEDHLGSKVILEAGQGANTFMKIHVLSTAGKKRRETETLEIGPPKLSVMLCSDSDISSPSFMD